MLIIISQQINVLVFYGKKFLLLLAINGFFHQMYSHIFGLKIYFDFRFLMYSYSAAPAYLDRTPADIDISHSIASHVRKIVISYFFIFQPLLFIPLQ